MNTPRLCHRLNWINFTLLAIGACGLIAATTAHAALRVEKAPYGETGDGAVVDLYTLQNSRGMRVQVITHGATLIGVEVPDREGKLANVTLHLDSWKQYAAGHPALGSTIGRYANRIGGAQFVIDGQTYALTPNAKPHHIHGGANGFGRKLWEARTVEGRFKVGVELSLTSPDGEEGYPGTVQVRAIYWLNEENELTFEYFAETDRLTHVNLTNHAYWNLGGAGSGRVFDHLLTLHADRYLTVDGQKIPLGDLAKVRGTPLDFTRPRRIGDRLEAVPGGGYDHCYVLHEKSAGKLRPAARVEDPKSGRVMEVLTTQPGVQLYTANYLSSKLSAGGKSYGPYHALCLETQAFPDAPNLPEFPSTLLKPGKTYHQVTVHRFSVKK
jgi:aldose 1-epimerase